MKGYIKFNLIFTTTFAIVCSLFGIIIELLYYTTRYGFSSFNHNRFYINSIVITMIVISLTWSLFYGKNRLSIDPKRSCFDELGCHDTLILLSLILGLPVIRFISTTPFIILIYYTLHGHSNILGILLLILFGVMSLLFLFAENKKYARIKKSIMDVEAKLGRIVFIE